MIRTHNCGELRAKDADKQVSMSGWVESIRVQGKIGFLLLRDRHGTTQVFLNPSLAKEAGSIPKESVVLIEGKVGKRPANQVKADMLTGEVEVAAETLTVLSQSETPLPIDVAEETTTSMDKRLDYRFLDVRRKKIQAIFKIRSKVVTLSTEFFSNDGFVNINTPKLTASGVESGAEEFRFDYFGKKASLAQSPQVYKQMFVVSGLEKVFEIGPIFRAEKSHTTRHLTEFVGLDFEMGFIKDEHDVMDVVERYFQFMIKRIVEECKEELAILGVTLTVPGKMPRLTIAEIREMLKEKGKVVPEDEDLDAEAEKMLGQIIKEKHGNEFVFALNYPWKKRPFYHMKPDDDPNGTKSFDLIFNGVEICTGAQREHRLEILEKQCEEKGIDLAKLSFYRDIFRFGAIPHGGVGLGIDRIVEQMLQLGNIREAILLPRDPERITP
ncbi:MAG: aspartate--tRNA(Asn) ligase [Candidatus Woesearchaeota archaeon]